MWLCLIECRWLLIGREQQITTMCPLRTRKDVGDAPIPNLDTFFFKIHRLLGFH
jgi:hypothetical protein